MVTTRWFTLQHPCDAVPSFRNQPISQVSLDAEANNHCPFLVIPGIFSAFPAFLSCVCLKYIRGAHPTYTKQQHQVD